MINPSVLRRSLPVLFVLLLIGSSAHAQVEVVPVPEAPVSPLRIASTTVGDTYISIVYSSPQMRGREIFGGLVPYGQVWRTGANKATEILLTGDVIMAGTPVAAGAYAVLTIPEASAWTIILHRTLGLDGSMDRDEALEAYRFEVPSETVNRQFEAFMIGFAEPADATVPGTVMTLNWDRTEVRIPITRP